MTRSLTVACLALIAFFLTSPRLSAQIYYPPVYGPRVYHPPSDPVHYPIEIGGFASLGGASTAAPNARGSYLIGAAGIYAQWNRYGLCPGVDVRIQGDSRNLHGYLVGPRVVYQPRGRMNPFRPYAETLFGKNETPYDSARAIISNPTSNSVSGVTRAVAIGLDLHSDSAFAWRVIEFTKGDFTGISGAHPQSITTGIVLHLP